MEFDVVPIDDPRVLRGMAHPVRGRLMDEIAARGSARATDLATSLGLPVSRISFHLRQLAKYGFIREDASQRKDNRERIWCLTSRDGLEVSDEITSRPGGAAAVESLLAQIVRVRQEEVRQFYAKDERPPGSYVTRDIPIRIKREQAEELADLIYRTIRTYVAEHQPTEATNEVSTYMVRLYVQPYLDTVPLTDLKDESPKIDG